MSINVLRLSRKVDERKPLISGALYSYVGDENDGLAACFLASTARTATLIRLPATSSTTCMLCHHLPATSYTTFATSFNGTLLHFSAFTGDGSWRWQYL
jgi:hypothetical protein